MKKYFSFAILALAGIVGFSSCSKDDNDNNSDIINTGNLTTPAYESDAAKYVISSNNAEYKSIELTASGEYIIIPKASPFQAKSRVTAELKGLNQFFGENTFATRAATSNIIYGKFTKTAENEYLLEGFGTVKIVTSEGTACSLTITPTGGTAYTLTAARQNTTTSSDMTNKLCRSWRINSLRFQFSFMGRSFDKTATIDNLYEIYKGLYTTFPEMTEGEPLMSKEEFDRNNRNNDFLSNPEKVVFTKSGTYMVYYSTSKIAVSTWMWEEEAKGVLRYSWNYQNMYDSGNSGTVTVEIKGSNLYIKENAKEGVVEAGMNAAVTYIMEEVK